MNKILMTTAVALSTAFLAVAANELHEVSTAQPAAKSTRDAHEMFVPASFDIEMKPDAVFIDSDDKSEGRH